MEKLSPIRPIGEVSAYSHSHPLCSLGMQGSDSTYGIEMHCICTPDRKPFTKFTILKDWNYLGLMNAEPILETNNYDDIVAWCKEHPFLALLIFFSLWNNHRD